jgi:hypothetical protein
MGNSKRNDLLKLRGWGPLLLSKIIAEVEKILSRSNNNSGSKTSFMQRDDDIPLSDEKESDA